MYFYRFVFQQQDMNKLPNKDTYGPKVRAVIICIQAGNLPQGLKYNHVDNTPRGLQTFISFARKKPGALHINFYCKQTGFFIEQFKF